MQVAYFKDISSRITPLLENAKDEVLIAMAWFTNRELFEALIDCRKRGVKVDLVLLDNAINWTNYAPDFNRLIELDGTIRVARKKKGQMHHKFCLIDSKTAVTGSYNWTYFAEKHNNENIILTESQSVVNSFISEFQKLIELFQPVSECRKLSWDEIEDEEFNQDINFTELNHEIESFVDIHPTYEKKVFVTSIEQVKTETISSSTIQEKVKEEPIETQLVKQEVTTQSRPLISPVENRFNPVAAFNIGIQATDEGGDDDILMPIIENGSKLPIIGDYTFNNYLESRDNLECVIYYGNSHKASENTLLDRRKVKEITDGRKDEMLKILIQFTLAPNGDLYTEIRCIETGKATEIKVNDSKLVVNQESK